MLLPTTRAMTSGADAATSDPTVTKGSEQRYTGRRPSLNE